jgi:hypothetical protein
LVRIAVTIRGAARQVIVESGDLAHWKSGHTFEAFALDEQNANRGAFSTLWEAGTSDTTILGDATATTQSPAGQTIAAAADVAADGRATNSVNGHFVGIIKEGPQFRLDQFFPDGGVNQIPKNVMRAIVQLFKSI